MAIEGSDSDIIKLKNQLNTSFTRDFTDYKSVDGELQKIAETKTFSNPVFAFWNIIKPEDMHAYIFDEDTGVPDNPQDESSWFKSNNWYDWNIRNWGTKWDVAVDDEEKHPDTYLMEQKKDFISYRFDTAWAMPLNAIKTLSTQFPSLKFTLSYKEVTGLGGEVEFTNGDMRDSIQEMKLGFMFEDDENFEYFMYELWEGKSNKYFSQNFEKELNLKNIFKLDDGIKNIFEMKEDILINEDSLEYLFLICCSLEQYNQSTKGNNSTFELGFFDNLDEQERINLTPWPTYWFGIEKNELIKSHIESKQYSQGQFAEAFISHELYDDSESAGYEEYEKNIVSLGKHYIKLLYEKGNEFLTQEGFEHFGSYYIMYEEYDEGGDGIGSECHYFSSGLRFRPIDKRDIELFFKPDSINHVINLIDAIDSDYIHEEFYLELKLIIKTILENCLSEVRTNKPENKSHG